MIQKQLSVFVENKPGVLAEVCRSLAAGGVGIRGLCVSDTVDHAVLRLVVEEPLKALHLLGERGTLVVETDVLGVELSSQPGALAAVLDRLAREKVNLEYAYGSSEGGRSMVFLRVSDLDRAREVLEA